MGTQLSWKVDKLFLAEIHDDLRKIQRKARDSNNTLEPVEMALAIEVVLTKIRDKSERDKVSEEFHDETYYAASGEIL